ncbi:unnamed protein product [Adineta steineri]|uniref:PLAT domain-containing protein n=1 Tax=Adineta steineri TaxID=433720 RepID=A0A818N0J6_9BILA|nr:unnamed protein product [Adineta steineri]
MITTKADRLLRSLIDAGLSLTDFTILAIKVIRIQRDFKTDNDSRRERDRLRQQDKLREQYQFEEQLKEDEQRRLKGLAKLRELGYVTGDDAYETGNNKAIDNLDQNSINNTGNKDNKIRPNQLLSYSKEMNDMTQKQRSCCLTFNIDYDLRLNQKTLESACRRAKRNIYELRADRFNRPEYRSVLSVETVTLHNKLKEITREINKIFLDENFQQDKRHLQELLTYINQFEGDIDLLMCQMQYEPKVKETILFSPVTTDILDRMNLILYSVRTLANKISTGDYLNEQNEINNDDIKNLSNIPTKVSYIIKIKTNNEKSSSLSDETNVTIRLYGTYNKSSDIHLTESTHKAKWQSGQIDLFSIELNYLGDIYAVEIWHNSDYSSWKVDWIEIIDDAANIYRFPLNRLLDKYSDEKKTRFIIQRDIGPVNRLPTKPLQENKPYKQLGFSTYKVQVKTGKQPNKVTDSSIFIELKGENGNFTDNLCSANSAFNSSVFEPDQLDTFYLIWPYLAKLNSLHLFVQSDGSQSSWFCEYINVEDSQTGDRYKFIVNQLFDGANTDDPNAKQQLTVYPENTNQKDKNDKPSYLLKLKTGDKGLSDSSTTSSSINIILRGEKGKSEPYILKSLDNKRNLFQNNQTDEFLLPSKYYVGPVKTLQISSNGEIQPWFIETIIIRDIAHGQNYIFPIYKWINTQDKTNTLTLQPINEQKPDYIVYTRTLASELLGPDRSIKLLLRGKNGKHDIELNNPITMYNTFQPGRKDEYYIENMKSLGDLQSIEIDITHPNIKKLGLDYIEIKDISTNNSYRFNINHMLDSKTPKMTAKAELISRPIKNSSSSKISRSQLSLPNTTNKINFDQLTTNPPQGAKRPNNDDYKRFIKTDDSNLINTNGNIELQMYENNDTSQKIHPNKRNTSSKNLSEKINQNELSLDIPNIENLKSTISFNDEKIKNQWSISTVENAKEDSQNVSGISLNKNDYSENSKSTSEYDNSEKDILKITIKTIDKQFRDKNTKLQIELIDENKQSEIMILNQTNNNIELLQKDKIDTFTIDTTKDLGKLKNIKLSLIGSKLQKDFYQPEYIEIFHPKSNNTYRIKYTKDDFLNSDKNRLELLKSIKLLSNTNIRETTLLPNKKLIDAVYSKHDDEDLSLLNNITTSSHSKETNSLSDRLTNSSSRQIRPGDRVKNNSKRQLIDPRSKSSLYEANWYRRSIETNKDHRNDVKQMQLTKDKRISQKKVDQRQAHIIKNRSR